ncbi:MAG: restriction endonuclease subunit S [Bacteroidales bacterium]|nr:restriction endonuclease subunit S [Bacteroidales bacterium]
MLEGLEISEVQLCELKADNGELRIDAEYYQKEYLNEDTCLSRIGVAKLSSYAFVTDGQHGYYESDPNSNIYMLAARNCKDYFANTIDALPLAKWVDDNNKRSSLQNEDIILSTRGSVGCCAIVYEEVLPANINQDVARIKLNDNNTFIPEFLITYLNCKYGQNWMLRNQTGMVQQGLSLDKVRSIPLPLLSIIFQQKIEHIVKAAHSNLSKSKSLYSEAEEYLLSELGIKGWQPNNNPVNIKHLKESFLASGRFDAEYYQSKYDEIETAVTKYKHGYDIIGNLFAQNTDVCDYQEDAYNYIEIGDINISDGTASFNLVLKEDLPDNAKRVLHTNDLLISKVRPYRGAVAIIDFDDERLIGSGAFTVLHERSSYKKEVLQILLRTQIYKDWLLKWNVGSSYPVIKDEDILNLPIPKIPNQVQTEITTFVQKSISLRNEAKQLLEDAKLMVESEIEKR